MTNIDRRRFVTSLGAATAVPAMTCAAPSSPHPAAKVSVSHERQTVDLSFLARHVRPDLPDSGVDFWSRPWCDITHARYLPREIARGTIWHERCDKTSVPAAIEAAASDAYAWTGQRMPRFAACAGQAALPSVLASLVGDGRPGSAKPRTAFIALDSLGPSDEPDWAEVLPAFRTCYGRIVGHFHLERRGLRQWKTWLETAFPERNSRSYFQSFFLDAAAQCDAVILTSPALAESDLRCCPRASTEELVGELMRDFGCALLTPAVCERIVGAGEYGPVRKPHFFALASLVLETIDDYYLSSIVMQGRQYVLVHGSFGDDIPGEKPPFVATVAEDAHSDLVDEFRRAAGGTFFTTTTPAYAVEKSGYSILNHLRMIMLWPFDPR